MRSAHPAPFDTAPITGQGNETLSAAARGWNHGNVVAGAAQPQVVGAL
jgi:hypothetical protein